MKNVEEAKAVIVKEMGKRDFCLVYTANHLKVIADGRVAFEFPAKKEYEFLSLFAKVRADAMRFLRENGDFSCERLDYRSYVHFEQGRLANDMVDFAGVEIDLNAAYWNAAKKLFLSDDTYLSGLNKKRIRLKALGALSAKKTTEVWEKGTMVSCVVERPVTNDIFFAVAKEVSRVVDTCHAAADECFAYYVDCVFLNDKSGVGRDIVRYIISNFGYGYKEIDCGYKIYYDEKFVTLQVNKSNNCTSYIFKRNDCGSKRIE